MKIENTNTDDNTFEIVDSDDEDSAIQNGMQAPNISNGDQIEPNASPELNSDAELVHLAIAISMQRDDSCNKMIFYGIFIVFWCEEKQTIRPQMPSY